MPVKVILQKISVYKVFILCNSASSATKQFSSFSTSLSSSILFFEGQILPRHRHWPCFIGFENAFPQNEVISCTGAFDLTLLSNVVDLHNLSLLLKYQNTIQKGFSWHSSIFKKMNFPSTSCWIWVLLCLVKVVFCFFTCLQELLIVSLSIGIM